MSNSSALEAFLAIYREFDAVQAAASLMHWDRQVLMPPGGGEARTAHVARLTRMKHELLTGDRMRTALERLESEAEPQSDAAVMARVLRRDINIESKLPLELVQRKASVASDAYDAWKQARAEGDFPRMIPYYRELFEIARETSASLGPCDHIYDNLIDLYEEGATFADADSMFRAIKQPIVDLVAEIRRGEPVDDGALCGDWNIEDLRRFAQQTCAAIGFDFDAGMLNTAPNAFCSNISTRDVRMTTRASDHIKGIVSSSLHEMGHGLYDQGSPLKWDRTPLAGGGSLAVHESQSRLWENIVGRSRGFWRRFLSDLQAIFPSLDGLDENSFYRAINKVEPAFIRVGADELTYNLHILIRFELEVEILTGQLAIQDLPEAWNEKYRTNLGIVPTTNTVGCLQDVHWSRGSIGYFPTYAMGNLIGGSLWRRMQTELGNLEATMSQGNFAPILGWLTERIYQKARSIPPRALIEEIVGVYLDPNAWLAYADEKYRSIYNLR